MSWKRLCKYLHCAMQRGTVSWTISMQRRRALLDRRLASHLENGLKAFSSRRSYRLTQGHREAPVLYRYTHLFRACLVNAVLLFQKHFPARLGAPVTPCRCPELHLSRSQFHFFPFSNLVASVAAYNWIGGEEESEMRGENISSLVRSVGSNEKQLRMYVIF